jgi:hypothetical protein
MTPPHMASATACSSSTTIHTKCGCGSLSPKTAHALSWKPSCWESNTCMHAITLRQARSPPVLKFDSDFVLEAATIRKMCARMSVGVKFSTPMPTTCSAEPNAHDAQSETTHLRCFTTWQSRISCGLALLTRLCTSATVPTAARLASPVASCPLSLRRRRRKPSTSASSGAPFTPRCPTSCVVNSAKSVSWRHGWLLALRPKVPHLQLTVPPHHYISPYCFPRKHTGLRRAFPG